MRIALLTVFVPSVTALASSLDLLMARGLTRREAECIAARHKRRTKTVLHDQELSIILNSLDAYKLLPEQAAYLLRSTPLRDLNPACSSQQETPVWCSYKKKLCNCQQLFDEQFMSHADTTKPRLLAVDCEFSPDRCGAVDETGNVRIDSLVLRTENAVRPSNVLECDFNSMTGQSKTQLLQSLVDLISPGGLWVAHTPEQDLQMLGSSLQELQARGIQVIDIAQLDPESTKGKLRSLRSMAQTHLGINIQEGRQHCAIQDARVTLLLFEKLS